MNRTVNLAVSKTIELVHYVKSWALINSNHQNNYIHKRFFQPICDVHWFIARIRSLHKFKIKSFAFQIKLSNWDFFFRSQSENSPSGFGHQKANTKKNIIWIFDFGVSLNVSSFVLIPSQVQKRKLQMWNAVAVITSLDNIDCTIQSMQKRLLNQS